MKKITKSLLGIAIVAIALCSCGGQKKQEAAPAAPAVTESGLNPEKFVKEIDGKKTALYTLKNKNGVEVCITNFGGRIASILVADKNGAKQDIALGFDNIDDYQNISSDFGACIGRYANRINQGKITIDGVEYRAERNYGRLYRVPVAVIRCEMIHPELYEAEMPAKRRRIMKILHHSLPAAAFIFIMFLMMGGAGGLSFMEYFTTKEGIILLALMVLLGIAQFIHWYLLYRNLDGKTGKK